MTPLVETAVRPNRVQPAATRRKHAADLTENRKSYNPICIRHPRMGGPRRNFAKMFSTRMIALRTCTSARCLCGRVYSCTNVDLPACESTIHMLLRGKKITASGLQLSSNVNFMRPV